ncbi:MAG: hypothetical protein Fur0022_04680 [Anaerolineales bacterium]
MNTPINLPLSKSPHKAETSQANYKRIMPRLIAGLVLGLALTALALFNRSNGQPQAEDITAVSYNNALEMQYAQPWLDEQNKPVIPYSNALEMQYAQPWLDAQAETDIPYSNALEMQYAQPWLDAQKSLDCPSRLDLFYACQNGWKPNGN